MTLGGWLDQIIGVVAPHRCHGCGRLGRVLCECCIKNIIKQADRVCVVCGGPAGSGLCRGCRAQVAYQRAWCAGVRRGLLRRVIGVYKFQSVRAAAAPLAALLAATLPPLPRRTVIVPLPTVSAHIRQRGFDHTLVMARQLAARCNRPCRPLLRRRGTQQQRGHNAAQRRRIAARAFACPARLDPATTYLLIDDVVTTGASLQYAAAALRAAGATTVWVAVVARQPDRPVQG